MSSRKQKKGLLIIMKIKRKSRVSVGGVITRVFISILLTLALLLALVYTLAYSLAHGPSTSFRDMLVNMAMQASATKWAPGLVLSQDVIDSILGAASNDDLNVIDPEQDAVERIWFNDEGEHQDVVTLPPDESDEKIREIDWSRAVDGIYYEEVVLAHCRAYVALIKDPSRVYTATSSDFKGNEPGIRFWDLAERENAVLMINGGAYPDTATGSGNGGKPIGITYSGGVCLWDDGVTSTFIGFDRNDRLVVTEKLTRAQAESLGIRDGCCFQTGNSLIVDGTVVSAKLGDVANSQRTAIGQCEDGTVIFVVTDGRTAASPGATFSDITQLMLSYGAVTAGMLDGGSSSMMYYRNYYNIYNYNQDELDDYQKMGLVNKYKAFTTPRRIPTYFVVGGAS